MNTGEREEDQKQQIEQLQAQLEHYQQRLEVQQQQLAQQRQRNAFLRQEFAQKYGLELLALIEGDPRAKIFVTTVVEKLVFQDEQGNVIAKSDGIPIGQVIEVKLIDTLSDSQQQNSSDSL